VGRQVLVEPQMKVTDYPKVIGTDVVQKMSKSLHNDIELAYTEAETLAKVMTMVTDPQRTHRNIPGRPEVCNVFTLHHSFTPPEDVERIAADCRSAKLGCVDDKKCLAANINNHLAAFRAKRADLAKDKDYVWDVLGDGAKRASAIADQTLREVKDAIGLP
jgi:tryptophanyl-tRNA synthetase